MFKNLACPLCKNDLAKKTKKLFCSSCNKAFEIKNYIPILLSGVKTDDYSQYWDKGWQSRFEKGDQSFHKENKINYYNSIKKLTHLCKDMKTPVSSVQVQSKNKNLLNIGCGMNEAPVITMMGVNNYIGIDFSYTAAKSSFDSIKKLGGNGITIQANAEILPIKSKSIDQVYSSGVLHHTPNIVVTLDEIYRVLKPGGIGVIGLYSKFSPKFIVAGIIGYLKFLISRKGKSWYSFTEGSWSTNGSLNPWTKTFSKEQVLLMLKKYNYSNIKIRSIGFQWGDVIPIFGKYFAKTLIGKKTASYLSDKLGSMFVITFNKIKLKQ